MKSRTIVLCLLLCGAVLWYSACAASVADQASALPQITIYPASLAFGDQRMGSTSNPSTVTLNNSGTSSLAIDGVSVKPDQFRLISGPALPAVLAPGERALVSLSFTPSVGGSITGSLSVSSTAGPRTVLLSGNGVAASALLSVSPDSLAFGNQFLGSTSGAQFVTLRNSGGSDVAVTDVSVKPPAFHLLSGPALPFTLAAGKSVTLALTFTPGAAGALTGTLTVTHSASSFPRTVWLSGAGIEGRSNGLTVTTSSLHSGYLGQPYSAVLSVSGGSAPYTWGLVSSSLPGGLTLDASQGQISGTPTEAGNFSLTVRVTDSTSPQSLSGMKIFDFTIPSGTLDAYGGVTALRCSGGAAPHFYEEKVGNRWWLCTPAGNGFMLKGVYHVNANDWSSGDTSPDYQGVVLSSAVAQKYGDNSVHWGPQAIARLRSWGFNATAEYSSWWVLPTTTNPSWTSTPDHSNPQKMPFTPIFWPSHYGRDPNSYAQPIKNLIAGVDGSICSWWCGRALPDVWDPNFAKYAQGVLTDPGSSEYGWIHSPHSDYVIGFNVDDTDELFGFGAGSEFDTSHTHTHVGWVVLVTAPTQTSGRDNHQNALQYQDPAVYSKQALANWLSQQYGGNITPLNLAWGSNYSTFGSNGGWGTGTGLLDENGSHSWVPRDAFTLNGATTQMRQDLDGFMLQQAAKYFSVLKNVFATAAPGIMYLGPTNLGGWGVPPRKQILQAASQYLDVITLGNVDMARQDKVEFVAQNGGDKPWVTWQGFWANPDSYMSFYQGGGDPTQQVRGQHFQTIVDQLFNTSDSKGTFHGVGYKWWEYYDNLHERANWGLVTRRDNAYDGRQTTTTSSTDSWGYAAGGEQATYGDFLDAVMAANLGLYKSILGLP